MCITALCTIFSAVSCKAYAAYGIRVNGSDFYAATYVGEDPYGEGFEQYLAHVYVHAGDYCQLYDSDNQAAWAVKLNESSINAFALNNDRYTCSTDGCYDFYIKLKYQNDQLYIGAGSDCSSTPSNPDTPVTPSDYATAVPSQCEDVMLQAFYWDSYQDKGFGDTKWQTLSGQVSEIGSYFDLVWLPPSHESQGGLGYIPKCYSSQSSTALGKKAALQSLISGLHNNGVRVIADIVINHCGNDNSACNFRSLDFGTYGQFSPQSNWMTSNDEGVTSYGCSGGANADDGQHEANYGPARDWDHKNVNVQNMCKAYLQWMKNVMLYDGFRYDYVGGYHVSHINDYNTASKPYFSVIEYWVGDAAELKTRIDQANKNTLAFDFAAKYTVYRDGIYQKNYTKCKGAGLLGKGYSKYAVTFIDNHDTFNRGNANEPNGAGNGSSINDKSLMMRCNAYLLSMPGVPCVFYPHWVKYKSEIQAMIKARKAAGVHSESTITEEAGTGYYRATVQGKHGSIKLMLGTAAGDAAPQGYTQAVKGSDYAMYYVSYGEGVENVEAEKHGEKFLKDGRLFIRRGEKVYDIMGRMVKR